MADLIYLKRYSTYSNRTNLTLNIEGNFPIQMPDSVCEPSSEAEQIAEYIEANNTIYTNTHTCEELGNLIDKRIFTKNPNLKGEKYVLTSIVYGDEKMECYECLP